MRKLAPILTTMLLSFAGISNSFASTPPKLVLNGELHSRGITYQICSNNVVYQLYNGTLTIKDKTLPNCSYSVIEINWQALSYCACSEQIPVTNNEQITITCINGSGAIELNGMLISNVNTIIAPVNYSLTNALATLCNTINIHLTNNNNNNENY
ncbi:MAG: hypothetical protein JW783_10325 [Bacteroidales bacterium]|nr:hypothetical protein [Bacteroidales bacterium]MBN2748950.1 hypothetical protein [Bacteroidales bacterium]